MRAVVTRHSSFISFSDILTLTCLFSDGLHDVYTHEGLAGLWRGTFLALVGVSNGALQFMAYEEFKRAGFARKRRKFEKEGREWTPGDERLVRTLPYGSSGGP